jgi:hypothetical protein
MRGLKTSRSLRIVVAGQAFVQNLRRGHYELATDRSTRARVRIAFGELAHRLWAGRQPMDQRTSTRSIDQCNSALLGVQVDRATICHRIQHRAEHSVCTPTR